MAANAQNSTIGAATCKAVVGKHLPMLLGETSAAQPLATACAAQQWLAPLVRRVAEAEDDEAVLADALAAALIKAPHADLVAAAIATEAAAEADSDDVLLGATTLLRLLRIKALPPPAVAALAPLVADTSGAALDALRALLPSEAMPLGLAAGGVFNIASPIAS